MNSEGYLYVTLNVHAEVDEYIICKKLIETIKTFFLIPIEHGICQTLNSINFY